MELVLNHGIEVDDTVAIFYRCPGMLGNLLGRTGKVLMLHPNGRDAFIQASCYEENYGWYIEITSLIKIELTQPYPRKI